ncbi:sialidase family protein [Polyangium aurulentum]|uniref:sialidase family protein n=1 Tax=Polyangium aurulentum TaxID=2567896 RepID=UPI0010AEB108|nr:sialidase family protein [Polyangium aurulentum]UQA60567.1 hypothetical protein E8A73_008875 [Polyangium aurulentum]
MNARSRCAFFFLVAASIAACGAEPPPGGGKDGQTWTEPACTSVSGTANVTFTLDEGATLAPTGNATLTARQAFVAALDTANTLLATNDGKLLRSTDAGCTWTPLGDVAQDLQLVAAEGGRAYGYTTIGANLVRIDGTTITKLTQPADELRGLGVDPTDGAHLRVGDDNGKLWESKDAGASWSPIGVTVPGVDPESGLVYVFAFDPANLDHIAVGTSLPPLHVSEDGGSTWQKPTGIGQGNANVLSIVISPADGNVVWAQGMDLDDLVNPDGRTIWRSTDRGLTFAPVVKQGSGVHIPNQTLLAADPTNTDVLYFFFNADVHRYDDATGNVTTKNNAHAETTSVAFSPAKPGLMYLGLQGFAPEN